MAKKKRHARIINWIRHSMWLPGVDVDDLDWEPLTPEQKRRADAAFSNSDFRGFSVQEALYSLTGRDEPGRASSHSRGTR